MANITLSFDVGEVAYSEKSVGFFVDSLYAGHASDTVTVLFYENRGPCDGPATDFTFGDRYLISARPCGDHPDRLCNDNCSLRRKLHKLPVVAASPAPPAADTVRADTVRGDTAAVRSDKKDSGRRRGWFRRRRKR
jgi:hypothetical protein